MENHGLFQMASFSLIICVGIISVSCLYAQRRHYDQLNMKMDWTFNEALTEELTKKLKELEELKKKVDALTLRAGFKI